MTTPIFVAYSMRAADEKFKMPDFKPPSTYKKPEAIAAWKREKEVNYALASVQQPYTGTLDKVTIMDPNSKKIGWWTHRAADSGKQPICLAIRSWLLTRYPDAWKFTTHPGRTPEAIFVGFNPRLFLKVLGLECSLPKNQPEDASSTNALPLSMWYGHSDYRDMAEAIRPKECDLGWASILQLRGVDAKKWIEPGVDVKEDLRIITELAAQLGMLIKDAE